jgi:hypothetical protein
VKAHHLSCRLCAGSAFIFLLLMSALEAHGQTSKHPDSKSRSPKVTENALYRRAQRAVNEFLTNWLILKDDAKAISFFAQEAFENRAILSEDCAGYIQSESRSSPETVERGIRKFLSDFQAGVNGSSLKDILTTESGLALTQSRKAQLINIPDRDRFWLSRFTPNLLKELGAEMAEQDYLERRVEGRNVIVSYLQLRLNIDDEPSKGALYFLWAPEKTGWKIIHAGLVCQ